MATKTKRAAKKTAKKTQKKESPLNMTVREIPLRKKFVLANAENASDKHQEHVDIHKEACDQAMAREAAPSDYQRGLSDGAYQALKDNPLIKHTNDLASLKAEFKFLEETVNSLELRLDELRAQRVLLAAKIERTEHDLNVSIRKITN